MKLINIGNIKNKQILDFIQEDIYYNSKFYSKSSERDIYILRKISIEEIDEEFIQKWNKMDWITIFKEKEQKFYDIICSLAKNLKDFNILNKLLYEQKKFDKAKVLISMQEVFINNFTSCSFDEYDKNIEIISNLIYYSDKKKVNVNQFLAQLEEKMFPKFLRNLYMIIIKNKIDLNSTTKKKLTNYIELDNSYENLIIMIKNLTKNNEKNFAKLKEYIIKEEDFLSLNDTFNFTLLKMLVSQNIIQDKKEQDNLFINKTLEKIESIKIRFLSEFCYNEVSLFLKKKTKIY